MTNSKNLQTHIFLVQPLRKETYKEMIVYADTEQDARNAAAVAGNPKRETSSTNEFSAETVFLNQGMSICIEIQPDIDQQENNLDGVRIQYNGVRYDLKKNAAQAVIVEDSY